MRLLSTLNLTETAHLVEGMIDDMSKGSENGHEKQAMLLEIMRMWELAIAQREKEIQNREKTVVRREEGVFQRETEVAKREKTAGKGTGTASSRNETSSPAVCSEVSTKRGRPDPEYTREDSCDGNPSKKHKIAPTPENLEAAVEKIILEVGRDVTLRHIKEGLQKSYPSWDVEACREELRDLSVRMVTELGFA